MTEGLILADVCSVSAASSPLTPHVLSPLGFDAYLDVGTLCGVPDCVGLLQLGVRTK
jgi:hypothetical protein